MSSKLPLTNKQKKAAQVQAQVQEKERALLNLAGPTGPTGPAGQNGNDGNKGDQGPTGVQGIQGIQGQQGEPGQKGDKGDQGPTGMAGPQGDRGNVSALSLTGFYYTFNNNLFQLHGDNGSVLLGNTGGAYYYNCINGNQIDVVNSILYTRPGEVWGFTLIVDNVESSAYPLTISLLVGNTVVARTDIICKNLAGMQSFGSSVLRSTSIPTMQYAIQGGYQPVSLRSNVPCNMINFTVVAHRLF